jgi:tRNA G37 N-methylase TrmD
MDINSISLVEDGDFTFHVSFMYGDHNLVTGELPRTVSQDDVLSTIQGVVDNWESSRADDNFVSLKEVFADQTISISDTKQGKVLSLSPTITAIKE